MRILWFVQANFDPSKERGGYNGAGWISSLRDEIINRENVSLAIAYFGNIDNKDRIGDVDYYSMAYPKLSLTHRIISNIVQNRSLKDEYETWPLYRIAMKNILNDFKPDIIQIFGSENKYGLISSCTRVPVVLHLQGLINPCFDAYLPPFVSWQEYINNSNTGNRRLRSKQKSNWQRLCLCEKEVLTHTNFFLGRTKWDELVVKLFNPNCKYYYCSEILRSTFYEDSQRIIPEKLVITSTISSPLYKGLDLILKTARLLKAMTNIDFIWNVYGNVDSKIIEKTTGIKHSDVNVEYKGVASAQDIKKALLYSTVYFHPSYIDNSPNSVCEAQILGCAVICTNVGGTSSLIKDGETGFLIPANDAYAGAFYLKKLYENPQLNIRIGGNAKKIAERRHDKERIASGLLDTYALIIKGE